MSNLQTLGTATYSDLKSRVVQAGGLTVLDFFADWCGPCKLLGAQLPKLSADNAKVNFVKVNIDTNQDIARKFAVEAVPQVVFTKPEDDDIKVLGTVVGFNMPAIKAGIQKWSD